MIDLDEAILEGLRAGQPTAYQVLVDEFEGPLYRFFVCDHRDHHLAQEQTAETFSQLVRSLPSMTGNVTQLPAFVFTIARRVKQRRWRRPQIHKVSIDEADDLSDKTARVDTRVEQTEDLELILRLIGQLDERSREAMLLRYVEEFSIGQIADALEIPPGTVKSLLHRSRELIKRKLNVVEDAK